MKVRTKFLLIFNCMVIICVIYIVFYTFSQFREKYTEDAHHDSQLVLQQLSHNLDSYLDEIYRLTLAPYYDSSIIKRLEEDNSADLQERLQKRREISAYLKSMMLVPRQDIGRVMMIADDSYTVSRYPFRDSSMYEQVVQSAWYQKALEEKETFMIFPQKDSSDSFSAFSVINVINSMKDRDRVIGVVRVDANFVTIKRLCREVELGEAGGVAILSEDGEVIFSNLSESMQQKINHAGKEEMNQIREEGVLVSSVPLERFGWTVLSFYSLKELNRQITVMTIAVILFSIVILVSGSCMLYGLLKLSLNPFYQILHLMVEVQNGNLKLRYEGEEKDEFGHLGKHLNLMLDSMKQTYQKNMELNKEIYRSNLEKQEMQLNLLYGQIRPHFIYNTLNMIAIKIQQGNRQEAVACINRLSIFLRGSAYIDKDIPLSEECRLLESYLWIQQARFGEALQYVIEIPPNYRNVYIPSLTLQVIVENAVVHGYENTGKDMMIQITCKECEEGITLCIEDNGEGISKEKMEQICSSLQEENRILGGELTKAGGLGLAIVEKRLKLRFGEHAGIYMESQEKKGTKVYVKIPVSLTEKEGKDDSDHCGGR